MAERPTAVRNASRTTERGPTSAVRKKTSRNGHTRGVATPLPNVPVPGAPGASPAQVTPHVYGEFAAIRADLEERLIELRSEYRLAMIDLRDLQRTREVATAGDDHTDAGTKTFEREQELTLAHGILERIDQVERAVARIDDGTYGQCERCGNQIGTARLEAYPSATLCVTCKQHQERR